MQEKIKQIWNSSIIEIATVSAELLFQSITQAGDCAES